MAIIKPEQLSSGLYNISGSFSGSFQGDGSGLNNLPIPSIDTGSLVTTSSFNAFTGSYNTGSFTGSFVGDGSGLTNIPTQSFETGSFVLTSSFNTFTSSYNTGSFTGSFTGSLSGTAVTASYVLNAVSASYADVANSVNDLNQNVFVSGTLTVLGGATFYGSSSFVYVTASQLAVSASFISVNVFEPVERFGGLKVYDSGSSTATASLAWDSLHNHWVYQNVSGATYTGGMLLSGPRNTGSLGDEPTLTQWFIPRGDGGDHLNDSQIYSSGSTHIVTGSLTVTQGVTGSLLGTSSFSISSSFASTASNISGNGNAFIQNGNSFGTTAILGTNDAQNLQLETNNNARVTISGSGEVGIGASPNANSKLIVAESAKIYSIIGTNTTNNSVGILGQTANPATGNLYGVYGIANSSAATNNVGLVGQAGNGVNNYSIQLLDGSQGIGKVLVSQTTDGKANWSSRLTGNYEITGSLIVTQNITASRTLISSSQNTISGSSLIVYGSGSALPVFTVQGSQGELFSVTDSLSGSLFSVNDISGLPILEVFSDNTTLMGSYLDPMLITTTKITQTNSGSFTVYNLPTASYDTAFFEYSVRSGSNARAGTIIAIQSGSSVNFTETTTTDFGNTTAVSFGVFVTGSNMALTGSSTSGAWVTKCIIRGV